jgi:ubiquinol-cytochrome c reductase iron-sulfur subunit
MGARYFIAGLSGFFLPSASNEEIPVASAPKPEPTRRDFLYIATGAAATVGVVYAAWPFIDQMNPTSAVLAMASIEIDVAAIQPGQQVVFKWRGHPLFVRRRTPKEIAEARAVPLSDLIDPLARNANLSESAPASDANRATKPEWQVLVGVCTHLGCTPEVSTPATPQGIYGGWLCHCHGSDYDSSGRIRKGPAPQNLAVPPYAFTGPTKIKVG